MDLKTGGVIFPVRPQSEPETAGSEAAVHSGMMNGRRSRHVAMPAFALLLCFAFTVQAETEKQGKCHEIDVPQTNAARALNLLVQQTGAKVLFPYEQVQSHPARAVAGCYTLTESLDLLLKGSGLTSELTPTGVLVISLEESQGADHSRKFEGKETMDTKKTALTAAIAYLLSGGSVQQGVAAPDSQMAQKTDLETSKRSRGIEEILVTATKRETRLQDTAMSISVVGKDEIRKRNIEGMTDYLNTLPGVSVFSQGPGQNTVIIRGMAISPTSEGSLTTSIAGVYLGEVPLSGLGFTGNQSDIKLVDMQRSEILRGPQGTLYGSGAMSGVVRNIPVSPDLNIMEGYVSGGYSNTTEEGGNNTSLKAAVNIPIVDDKFAVRAVAYSIDNSGYYKNIAASDSAFIADVEGIYGGMVTSDKDEEVGGDKASGVRISALWQASDNVELNLMHLSQESERSGKAETETALGGKWSQRRYQLFTDPLNESPIADNERVEDDVSITNLTANIDLNSLSIVSSTSVANTEASVKFNNVLGFPTTLFPYPVGFYQDFDNESFSQEIRLVSEFDSNWQFIAGLFYSDLEQNSDISSFFNGEPELNAALPGEFFLLKGDFTKSIQQKAVFGEVYYNATDKLKFIVGGRAFNYQFDQQLNSNFFLINTESSSDLASDESDTTGKVGLEYTPNDDTLLYSTWSQGFRLGYPSFDFNPLCDSNNDGLVDGSSVSVSGHVINSDSVDSIEIGGKFSLLDNSLQLSAALFNLKWTDVPVSVQFDNCAATVNAGEATSNGVELSVSYHVNDSLLLDFNTSYIDAELDNDVPSLGANSGDRLPGSPRFNASLGLEYRFALAGYDSYLRADYSYSGDYYTDLKQTSRKLGDYGMLNANLGIAMDNFDISLYAHNLTNEDSFTWAATLPIRGESGNRLRPRTLGLNLTYRF